MLFDPNQTVLAGVSRATLLTWLASAQAALAALNTGQYSVSVSYSDKSVTYTTAQIGALTVWIHQLQRQLGLVHARRALRPYFR